MGTGIIYCWTINGSPTTTLAGFRLWLKCIRKKDGVLQRFSIIKRIYNSSLSAEQKRDRVRWGTWWKNYLKIDRSSSERKKRLRSIKRFLYPHNTASKHIHIWVPQATGWEVGGCSWLSLISRVFGSGVALVTAVNCSFELLIELWNPSSL